MTFSRHGGRKAVDAVLFDLDGTLLDTTGIIIASMKYTVEHFTGVTPDYKDLYPYMGLPLAEMLDGLVPGHAEEAYEVYVQHNLSIHDEAVKPFPGVPEMLETLRHWGVKRAIVTSKRRNSMTRGLSVTGLTDMFDAIVCHGEANKAKPEPEPVLLALNLLGLGDGPAGVIFVGDSPWDVQAAANARKRLPRTKIVTVAVTYGAHTREDLEAEGPDHLLDNIKDLLPLVWEQV